MFAHCRLCCAKCVWVVCGWLLGEMQHLTTRLSMCMHEYMVSVLAVSFRPSFFIDSCVALETCNVHATHTHTDMVLSPHVFLLLETNTRHIGFYRLLLHPLSFSFCLYIYTVSCTHIFELRIIRITTMNEVTCSGANDHASG